MLNRDCRSPMACSRTSCSRLAWTLRALVLVFLGSCALVHPQVALGQSKPFSAADLELKNEHGPWLILAYTFEGDGAKKKAVQLAAELRKDFGLNAYCLPKSFDYSQSVTGAGITEDGKERKMRYRDDRVLETCAVLVGDFDTMDGVTIDDTLTKIKNVQPKFFMSPDAKSKGNDTVSTNEYRSYLQGLLKPKASAEKTVGTGPMRFAFKTRNPLLPAEYYRSPEVDRFVRKMNQEKPFDEYNLLQCDKKFTVQILTLRGTDSYVSWGRSADKEESVTQASQLEQAAEKAYLVTKTLRLAGYEAYQFHDRNQSIVCVGGFDNLGTTDKQNNFTYDPAILAVVNRFAGTAGVTHSQFGTSQTPRILLDDIVDSKIVPELQVADKKLRIQNFSKLTVAFDLVPIPRMIPKVQATAIYSDYALGK